MAVPLHPRRAATAIRMTAAKQFRVADPRASDEPLLVDADESSFGPAKEDRTGRAYNQAMFRHLLMLERKRFERSGRPFLLLLAELRKPLQTETHFESKVAGRLFDALWQSLRETDFVGWYRDRRVVGAVLTQPIETAGANTARAIRERLSEALCEKLAPQIAVRLHVTVHQFPKEQNWPWL
jgi:hypothetical protein